MRNILLLLLLFASRSLLGQTPTELDNIEAFNRLFGYVRYFHPSDEASQLDWDKFAAYGSKKVEKCANSNELLKVLTALFGPIAPAVKVFLSSQELSFSIDSITPADKKKYKTVTWEHLGLGSENPQNLYKSVRLNKDKISLEKEGWIRFKHPCKIGDYVKKEIGSGLTALVPLALYGNIVSTYPKADEEKLQALKNELKKDSTDSAKDLYVRIGDLIVAWNIFQHFYPYFDVVKCDWPGVFRSTLAETYSNQTEYDFLKTLRKFTAQLKDGHVLVNAPASSGKEDFALPLQWEWIEDQLVITRVFANNLPLKTGDIVTTIDHQPPKKYFGQVYPYISAATNGWLQYRAQTSSILGPEYSKVVVGISRDRDKETEVILDRNVNIGKYYGLIRSKNDEPVRKISDHIYYINIGAASMDQIKERLSEFQQAKALICDLRGYPNGNHEFISYLLNQKDTSRSWMRVPEITYPDQENVHYRNFGWTLKPLQPHLNAKVFFIIDGQAISYAESYLGFIEHYKLATIIGQPSAGTNGNINPFTLRGSYSISWTGMKVVKHDGSQHHGIGIIPNIFVNKTISAVRDNEDEFLNKAIELAGKVN